MTPSRAVVAAAALLLLLLIMGLVGCNGCHDDEASPIATPSDAASAVDLSATNDASPFVRGRMHQGPVPHTILAPCRAIAVDGDAGTFDEATDSGVALAANSPLPRAPWIDLADGARVTVKDPRTMRETVLVGAARARACVDRAEEMWLARGTLEASPGAGDSPGAEEWVATSAGVVRISASRARITVDGARATVLVASGGVSVWPADDARATFAGEAGNAPAKPESDGWIRVTTDAPLALDVASALSAHAKGATAKCESASAESKALAAQIADGGPLDDLAPKDVRARTIWRAACALAQVAVAGLAAKDRLALASRVSAAAPYRQAR